VPAVRLIRADVSNAGRSVCQSRSPDFIRIAAGGFFKSKRVISVRELLSHYDNDPAHKHPEVIVRTNQASYALAVEPAIQLLADPRFEAANLEFLGALEDYRKGRYGDCLTKCGSALESTMKLICRHKGWPYNENATAAPLLNVIRTRSGLESFFVQPILNIATLRNRFSTAHGGGTTPRSVPAHKARYAINATASAILLLVEECR
jgi:Domain of unknown function (DUF7014)/Abortive infection C-terminus